MFGRLEIPVGKRGVLRIPISAVHHIGQLDYVDVLDGSKSQHRVVRLGELREGFYEVLSGLKTGESVKAVGDKHEF
jgi:multidrug efflux pump subunit AcrA (membrane-fusion protein)